MSPWEVHIESVQHARQLGVENNPEYYVGWHFNYARGVTPVCCKRCCGRRCGLVEIYCVAGEHLMTALPGHLFYVRATDGNGFASTDKPMVYTWECLRRLPDVGDCDKNCGRKLVSEVNTEILCGLAECMQPVKRRYVKLMACVFSQEDR